MALDIEKLSSQIVELVGGRENISSVTHCTTRMRFNLKDKSKAKGSEIKALKGVLGVADQSGQFQVILGENLFPVYEAIVHGYNLDEDEVVNETIKEDLNIGKKGFKYYLLKVSQFLSSSLAPFITILYGAGMLRVITSLVSFFWPDVATNTTYVLFNQLANVPFYFLPVMVAYGAARTLKANPIFAITMACMLVYPDWVALVNAGESVSMFGIPVTLITYSSSLLPAIFSAILLAYLEKFFYKVIPGVLRLVFAPLCTLAVAFPIVMLVLGPVGNIVGGWIVSIFVWIENTFGGLGVGLFAAGFPFLVMMGVNMLTVAPMTELFTRQGYDNFFRPGYIIHNCAEGGACLGVFLRAKNKELKSAALSAAIGGIVSGVSEPAIYGIMIPLKKPLYAVMIGALAGGTVAGVMGASAFSMGYSSVLAIPIFESTALAITVGIILTIALSCIVTYIIGFDESAYKG